ncbi:MAG TPA: PP2C family serine/threonine-protein phosphatase [Burkholderiales bacterium]
MEFAISLLSRIGGRETNEDRAAYVRTAQSLLLVVADGMGGHAHGEVAAEIVVGTLTEAFLSRARPRLQNPEGFLQESSRAAHLAIVERALAERLDDIPGSTCVACVVQDGRAWWAHAGDSRLYHLRGGRTLARTRDHSLLRQIADSVGLSEEDAAVLAGGRNVIYSCIGGYQNPQIEFGRSAKLEDGDLLLLCSDGLWGSLSDAEIGDGLGAGSLAQALPRLAAEAEQRGGGTSDNVTALALAWGVREDGAPPAPAGQVVFVGFGE